MSGNLSGRAVLMWVCGFFAVVIAVNATFITLSITSFSGEDEQKPYLQGIAFNDTLQRRALQSTLGWQAVMSADRLPSGQVQLTVQLRQPPGTKDSPAMLEGELRHPANENRDRLFALVKTGPGFYRAELKGVGAGAWDMIVKSERQQPFEASRRLWVR